MVVGDLQKASELVTKMQFALAEQTDAIRDIKDLLEEYQEFLSQCVKEQTREVKRIKRIIVKEL